MKVREAIAILTRNGWKLKSIRGGSHAKFIRGTQHVIIPHYNHQNMDLHTNEPAQKAALNE
jgi:predicted RNA binding protein YcfA (HicA-like mRNA interferase family)